MNSPRSILELFPRILRGEKLSNGAHRTERRFLDFVVDGLSLHEALVRKYDLASVLWIDAPVPEAIEKRVRQLLLIDPADLPDGRIALYTCPECGDLGCGGITLDIKLHGDIIIWSNFGYQNNYDGELYQEDRFRQYGPFHFEMNHYRAVLLSAMPAHRE